MDIQKEDYMQTYNQRLELELENERNRRLQSDNEISKISAYSINETPGVAEISTEVEKELDRIYHLLSGDKAFKTEEGEGWKPAADDRMKILSDYGVDKIMELMSFYVSKVHILSYYPDDKEIKSMTYEFGMKLADLIHNRYEMFFHYPKPEELYEELSPIVLQTPEDFPSYIIYDEQGNKTIDENKFYKECVKLSEQELDSKLPHFPMICLALVHSVHSTLMKAYKGETARNLRTMAHIHQNISSGNPNLQQPKQSLLGRVTPWKNT